MNEIDKKLKEVKKHFDKYMSDVPFVDTDQFCDMANNNPEASAFYNGFTAGRDSIRAAEAVEG